MPLKRKKELKRRLVQRKDRDRKRAARAIESNQEGEERRAHNRESMAGHRATESNQEGEERRAHNRASMAGHRATESNQEGEERRAHNRASMAEQRSNQLPEQSQQERDSARERMQCFRNMIARSTLRSGRTSAFDMTHSQLVDLEREWIADPTSYDVSMFRDDAVLMLYLNSGLFRFGEHLSYSRGHLDKAIDCDSVVKEIQDEILTDKELYAVSEKFYKAHDFNARMYSCGTCGIRQFESVNESATIEYHKVVLESLPDVYKYSEEADAKLFDLIHRRLHEQETSPLKPWKMISYYTSEKLECTFHLHPELVEKDGNGKEFTLVCPRCWKAINNGTAYKLSVAMGVDFGNWQRVSGLEEPNLHEQLILSTNRLYSATIKVHPNGSGFQQNHGMNAMRGNQVLFAHDSVSQVNHATITDDELDAVLTVQFYNDRDQVDSLARKAYGTSKLFARTRVLRQWFQVLRQTNGNYAAIDENVINTLMEKVKESVERKKKHPVYITDEGSLLHERGLGSDVAAVQQVDAMTSNYNSETTTSTDTTSPSRNGHELPMTTHYVSLVVDNATNNEAFRKKVAIKSLGKLFLDAGNDGDNNQIAQEDILDRLLGRDTRESKTVNCVRGSDPLSEFIKNDDLLGGTFPWVFPLGRAYGRGCNLSNELMDHMLKQFHMVPSKDMRLLGYLADVKRRHAVIQRSAFKLTGHQKAIKKVNNFLNNNEHHSRLKELKENPDNPQAKKLWKEFRPLLENISSNVMYGALEASRCITQTFETSKRYGPGGLFLTLSLDDVNNSRAIRTAIKTTSNRQFPAVFGGTSGPHVSLEAFHDAIKETYRDHGCGIISLDGEAPGMTLQRQYLSKLAMESPVAYVLETKLILNHVLTILFGRPPEGFFSAYDGPSKRKTQYYKNVGKGIFGHTLAYAGVVEDHVKGTLHFHIVMLGSISPYVLQELASVQRVCNKVAEALDFFYQAKFSPQTNFRNMVTRQLRKASNINETKAEPLSPPALLQRVRPLQQIEAATGRLDECSIVDIAQLTANERASSCFHEHHRTCKKGFNGRHRCRLAKKSGVCNGTYCVILEPVKYQEESVINNHQNQSEDSENEDPMDDMIQSAESERNYIAPVHEPTAKERTKFDSKDLCPYKIKHITWDPNPRHQTLHNPIHHSREQIIVWELDRPVPDVSTINGLSHIRSIDGLRVEQNSINEEPVRQAIINNCTRLLAKETGTIGHPYNSTSTLWDFLRTGDISKVASFYNGLVTALKTANQYTVDHSVMLSFCTGSHNNTELLGGKQQAKSAMFYIAPYMAKEKASLTVCLTILEKSRRDVLAYESKAADRTEKIQERLTKRFLTRVANHMNEFVELSIHQVIALLCNIPPILTSECFQYVETSAAINYREHLLKGDDSEGSAGDDELDMGYCKTFLLEEGEDENDPNKDIKKVIPIVACYYHRGKDLQQLSLYEYSSTVQTKLLPKQEARSRSTWFRFGERFDLAPRFGQTLRAKQRTSIFKGRTPIHPGKRPPADSGRYASWFKKANSYANYLLTMYRPSQIYNGVSDTNNFNQDFQWEDLQEWISQLQDDERVISKFRLMAIERRMNALGSDFCAKKILSDYRARVADQWTDVEKGLYANEERYFQNAQRRHDAEMVDDDLFEELHSQLSAREANSARNLNNDALGFRNTLVHTFNELTQTFRPSQHGRHPSDSCLCRMMQDDWDEKVDNIYGESINCITNEEQNEPENQPSASRRGASWKQAICSMALEGCNQGQREIVSMYAQYLLSDQSDTSTSGKRPPKVVLLTGKGGTGKSFIIHRLLEIGSKSVTDGNSVWTTANNNLNAADINGCTIASLLGTAIQSIPANGEPSKINSKAVQKLQDKGVANLKLLIIDEISNVTADKLGQLSRVFALATGNKNERPRFGQDICVLFVGDYNQKKPVGGPLATFSVLEKVGNEKQLAEQTLSREQQAKQKRRANRPKPKLIGKQKRNKDPRSDTIFAGNYHSWISDNSLGCNILAEARWFELTESQRSHDAAHNEFNDRRYNGIPFSATELKQYQLFNQDTLKHDSKEEQEAWLSAPVIVMTNRERMTLNYIRALEFAK
ncbi:MAG: hypothetical protein SGBAC_011222 [Bacillariaceae sp.]